MTLRGVKAVRKSGQWLLGKMVRHALILGYHRISDGPDPYQMSVSPGRFAEQLAVLARIAHPLPLEVLPQLLRMGQLPKRAVAVTFDDGYADVLHRAKPLLARFGVPATVFVISGALGCELWWDRLDRISSRAAALDRRLVLTIGNTVFDWPLEGVSRSAGALRQALYPKLRTLAQPARDAVLDQLEELMGADDLGQGGLQRVVTADELRCLGEGELVQIGAHTVTHPALSQQSAAQQRQEIAGSRWDLEAALGRPVTAFSYPFGDTGPGVSTIVHEAGYHYACESRNAVAWRGTDRFSLPRFWMPDWDGVRFAGWLERWLDD
ncbi:MAG TPA: polysaccharide deacetylase family protein [Gemmatimonadales bacterium]|nr:polysaccharide deacetylase family protein [Gemmatimonadales bacterium]